MDRNELYYQYLLELQTYNPTIHPIKGHNYVEDILQYEVQWIDIVKDGCPIGFLLIGYGQNKHPSSDYYIQEAFILPEHRRERRMFRVVSEFLSLHKGKYCMFILNSNKVAKAFWRKVVKENHCKWISLIDVGAADEYCQQYGFVTPVEAP